MGPSSNQVTFQSPFPASLKCLLGKFPDYDSNVRVIRKELPLHSVQKLIVNMAFELEDQELEWFRGLLRDLKCLEQIEMGVSVVVCFGGYVAVWRKKGSTLMLRP